MLLAVNPGSSTLKYSVFDLNNRCVETKNIHIADKDENDIKELFLNQLGEFNIEYIGYRVVHGGNLDSPQIITDEIYERIINLSSFAPLHQPKSLYWINFLKDIYPKAIHYACFDTSFHLCIPKINRIFPLPRRYFDKGIMRYGFHGLAYQSVVRKLNDSELLNGKIIAAHLGSGSSLCAMNSSQSIATTMGFTALEGLMMGTRSGSIDPGVILYMLKEEKLSIDQVECILYKKSGLLGVSEKSSDMRYLSLNNLFEKEAIDLYISRIVQESFSLVAMLGGVDGIVFSGGIGENNKYIRDEVLKKIKLIKEVKSYVINVDEQAEIAFACDKIK